MNNADIKNICTGKCKDCSQSFNPVYCLAPHFHVDSFEPTNSIRLCKIKDSIKKRLNSGSTWYDTSGLREKDIEALKRIEEYLNDHSRQCI